MIKIYSLVAICVLSLSTGVHAGSSSKNHQVQEADGLFQAGGQAAFAEIATIVQELEANPGTDWDKVNIPALRQHLIDMNNVVMQAEVTSRKLAKGNEFTVTSSDPHVVASIIAMSQGHGMMMSADRMAWQVDTLSNGARVTVTAEDPTTQAKIVGLGFIGLLTLGDHHSAHHRMMASGLNPH